MLHKLVPAAMAIMLTAGFTGFAPEASAQSLKFRMSSEDPASSPLPIMARKFGDILAGKIDGFEYDMFDTASLGDEVVHMQMIRTGQIDVYPMGSDAVALDPAWAIFDMPFLFKDRETVYRMLDGEVGAALAESMRNSANLEVLAFGEIGFRQITNNVRPVLKPEDLNGVKLRVPGSQTRILAFERLGAAPITMNFNELYLALQNGTVDGQENPLALIKGQSFQEVQKFLSLSNHVYTPVTFVMNGAAYDRLSDEQKAAVREAAAEAAAFSREEGRVSDETLVGEFREALQVDEIDIEAFQAAARGSWDEIGKIAGEELAARVIEAVSQ